MKVTLTGFPEGKKIHAIKAVRAASRIGLKEAKDAVDAVELGGEVVMSVVANGLGDLDEGGVAYRVVTPAAGLGEFVEVLESYPRDLTVGTMLDVLRPAVHMEAVRAAVAASQGQED